MVITYYGGSCFKVQSGETVLVFDPPSKDSEFKSPRVQTDVALISYNDKDFNGWENLSGKEENKAPFVIDGPGEYEVKGINIKGITNSPDNLNIVYILSLEGVTLCHLGAFDDSDLIPELKEDMGDLDILFVPISENISKKTSLVNKIDSKIIIPMHYKDKELKEFIKEFGDGSVKSIDKLTVKKRDLAEKKNEIVVLSTG